MHIIIVDNGTALLGALEKLTHTHDVISYDEITPEHIEKADVIVLSGAQGTFPIAGHEEELSLEMELVRNTEKPIIGICYGAQIIARSFGASLERMPEHHQGKVRVVAQSTHPCSACVSDTCMYENHAWCIRDLPEEVFEIVGSSEHAVELFRHKERPIWGMQFHPEYHPEIFGGASLFACVLDDASKHVCTKK